MIAMSATFLNVREAAARLGVHENTIRNWESKGILRATHLPVSQYRRFEAGKIERMQREMRSQLAQADEGYLIEPALPVKGEIIYGDLKG
jgi:DNA-binding transcriptional MerR regulator